MNEQGIAIIDTCLKRTGAAEGIVAACLSDGSGHCVTSAFLNQLRNCDCHVPGRHGRTLTARQHAVVAALVLLASLLLARLGIVALIAAGYGNMAWGYLLVYVLPLLSLGIYRMLGSRTSSPPLRAGC